MQKTDQSPDRMEKNRAFIRASHSATDIAQACDVVYKMSNVTVHEMAVS